MKTIYVAGGCFWGVQEYFNRLKGVGDTEVGYANGDSANPTYGDLKAHKASHAETVKVCYDDKILPIEKICEHLLRIVDPFAIDHQGEDFGHQYRTGIYFIDKSDGEKINAYFDKITGHEKFEIEILPLKNFYTAEEYHQMYLRQNPAGYCHIDFSKILPEERK